MGSIAGKYAQAQIRKLGVEKSQSNKVILEQIEKNLRELIENFLAWEVAPIGSPPITRAGERSPSGLRRYVTGLIAKAARVSLGPKSQDFWTFANTATTALATAWAIEWEQDRPNRERAELNKARAESERREHEAALKPDAKRISDLHAIIREGAAGEKLLADVYRAFKAHEDAKRARKDLQELKDKAENAAFALGKKAPVIDVPAASPSTAADELAAIFYRALNAMPR